MVQLRSETFFVIITHLLAQLLNLICLKVLVTTDKISISRPTLIVKLSSLWTILVLKFIYTYFNYPKTILEHLRDFLKWLEASRTDLWGSSHPTTPYGKKHTCMWDLRASISTLMKLHFGHLTMGRIQIQWLTAKFKFVSVKEKPIAVTVNIATQFLCHQVGVSHHMHLEEKLL